MSDKKIQVLSNMIVENGHVTSIEREKNYLHPTTVWQLMSSIAFGEYTFNMQELGELLNELMEAKKASDKK